MENERETKKELDFDRLEQVNGGTDDSESTFWCPFCGEKLTAKIIRGGVVVPENHNCPNKPKYS